MTRKEIKLAAIETKWKNSNGLWIHGPGAKADIAWLVNKVKQLNRLLESQSK